MTASLVANLTNLEELRLQREEGLLQSKALAVTEGVSNLAKLKKLNLENDALFSDNHLEKLTALEELCLGHRSLISASSLMLLPNLTSLNLDNNDKISGGDIQQLINLRKLKVFNHETLSSASLLPLINLTELDLFNASKLSQAAEKGNPIFSGLTDLRKLRLHHLNNQSVSGKIFSHLTNLTDLNLDNSEVYTMEFRPRNPSQPHVLFYHATHLEYACLSSLTKLRSLKLGLRAESQYVDEIKVEYEQLVRGLPNLQDL